MPSSAPKICNEKGCYGFQWIGQSLASCDKCGLPYWEHTHDETFLRGRVFRRIITREMAEAVQGRWGSSDG